LAIQSLNRAELLALLKTAAAGRQRDWLMILVAFSHGLRASEVVAIVRDDIADGFLTVQRLKGSLKTTQELIESEDPLLNERKGVFDYTRGMAGNQRLFPIGREYFWKLMRRYAEQAGIPSHKRHPHILKHSIAMQTIHSAGIENVRQHLGHKSIASTGEYLKVSDSEASAAVQRALKS
jgi:integrase/recombinase XerD